jgi:hypothetical protein
MPENFFELSNPNFLGTMVRFVLNLIFLTILIRFIYFKYTKKEKFVFTFFLIGIMVFFLTSALNSVFMQLSMGFGLFAIFAIIRFRTRSFSLKDMSYIFTVIGISVINSLKVVGFPGMGIVIFNIIIILTAYILERFSSKYSTSTHTIIYQNLDLLKAGRKQKLLKDISEMTGRDILKVKIRRVNFKDNTALLDIYYKD